MRSRKATLAVVLVSLWALVYVLACIGGFHPFPAPNTLTIEYGASEDIGDEIGAIVDQSGERLVILDGNQQVVNAINVLNMDGSYVYYDEVVTSGENVYVCEYSYREDSEYLDFMRIAKYDSAGNREAILAQVDFALDEHRTMVPTVLDMHIEEDGGVAVINDPSNGSIGLLHFSLSGTETVDFQAIEDFGPLPSGASALAAHYISETESVVCVDPFSNFYLRSSGDSSFAKLDLDDLVDGESVSSLIEDMDVLDGTGISSEGKSFAYTPRVFIVAVQYWVCVLYLALLAIVLLAFGARKAIRANNPRALGIGLGVILVLGIVVATVLYYSYDIRETQQEQTERSLIWSSSTLSSALNDELADALLAYDQGDDKTKADVCLEISEKLEDVSYRTALAGESFDLDLIRRGSDGEAVTIGFMEFTKLSDSAIAVDMNSTMSFDELVYGGKCLSARSPYNNSLYAASPIYDSSGNVVGALAASTEVAPSNVREIAKCIQMFLTLVDALVVAAFILMEALNLARSVQARNRYRAHDLDRSQVAQAASRPLTFLGIGCHACVNVLLSVVSQDILVNAGQAADSLLVAVPSTLAAFGLLAGIPFGHILSKHMRSRARMISCGLGAALFFAGGGYAVASGSFALLCLMVFFGSMCVTPVVSFSTGLPLLMPDDAERAQLNYSLSARQLSAAALTGIFVGFLAEQFGNQWAFFLGSALALLIVPVALIFLPGSNWEESARKDGAREVAKRRTIPSALREVLTDPIMASLLICIVAPMAIVGGYRSYLFPLLVSDAGISKSAITSFIVYCNALSYFVSPLVARAMYRVGNRAFILGGFAFLAVVFLIFSINSNVIWMVAALALSMLTMNALEPGYTTFWQTRVNQTGASDGAAHASTYYLERGGEALRAPVFGGLSAVFGACMACHVVGVALTAFMAIFAFVTRKSRRNSGNRGESAPIA